MKYFSLFTGIGGFELGIQQATNGGWECVGYSEIDKYAIQTFEKNFPNIKNYGDCDFSTSILYVLDENDKVLISPRECRTNNDLKYAIEMLIMRSKE
jgi:site-specific DNA-cytosine methylase